MYNTCLNTCTCIFVISCDIVWFPVILLKPRPMPTVSADTEQQKYNRASSRHSFNHQDHQECRYRAEVWTVQQTKSKKMLALTVSVRVVALVQPMPSLSQFSILTFHQSRSSDIRPRICMVDVLSKLSFELPTTICCLQFMSMFTYIQNVDTRWNVDTISENEVVSMSVPLR